MRTRREIERRLSQEVDAFVIDILKWVLVTDCLFCDHADRKEYEVEINAEEMTPAYLEAKHGWSEGLVMNHMDNHIEYDAKEASHIEAARQQSINTLDTASDIVNRIVGYLNELEALKEVEGITSEFVSDATRLIGQANTSLKLVGQLKKEIGVDSQLLLAEARMNDLSRILVDTLRGHPELLDTVELRMSALKSPIIDVEYEVTEG